MESTSSIVPLPQTGVFDEETCRYFLREIGAQIVPFYPFSFGIDEVYTLLLERYGEDWVADALSVLHELMEADDNAGGLGDDGDIWRSWRHSWRHRNVRVNDFATLQSMTLRDRTILRSLSSPESVVLYFLRQPREQDAEPGLQASQHGAQRHRSK
jgi:hypothetical protein